MAPRSERGGRRVTAKGTQAGSKPAPPRDDSSSGRYTPPIPKAREGQPAVGAGPDVRAARPRRADDHPQLPRGCCPGTPATGTCSPASACILGRHHHRDPVTADRSSPGCGSKPGVIVEHRVYNSVHVTAVLHSLWRHVSRHGHSIGRDEVHVLLAVPGRSGTRRCQRHPHLGAADRAAVASFTLRSSPGGGGSGTASARPPSITEPDAEHEQRRPGRPTVAQTIVPNIVPTATTPQPGGPRSSPMRTALGRRVAPPSTSPGAR